MIRMMRFQQRMTLALVLAAVLTWALGGCTDDIDDGFQDDFSTTAVIPRILAANLNFPWGVLFVDNTDADGVGSGSVVGSGNLLIANRGTVGEWANTVTQIDPHSGQISVYSHAGLTDSNGVPAVDGPHDVAFAGPFVWIANDAGGLGTVAVTDPNPSVAPNGMTGRSGEPVPGPAGTGIFGTGDLGFIVTSVTPEDQAIGVFHHTVIAVEFSSPVNPDSVTADSFQVQVDYSPQSPDPKDPTGSFSFSSDYLRVEFVYIDDLVEGTRYKIVLDKDIVNIDGVNLDGDLDSPGPDDFTSTFMVGSGSPMVIWVRPENGSSFVATDTVVQVGFSEPVKASSVTTAAFFITDADGDKIAGDTHVDASLTVASFVPRDPLPGTMDFTVEVNYRVQDLSGNPLDQIPGGLPDRFTSRFSTGGGSTQPPQVASAVITGDNLIVDFTADIDPASRTGSYLTVTDSGSRVVPGSITWPASAQLMFSATNGFSEGIYRVCIEDVLTDMQGTALDGDFDGVPGGRYCTDLTVGGDRLYVTSSYPEDGNTDIGVTTMLYMNFSTPVNPASVTGGSVFLESVNAPGSFIPAALTLNPGNTSVTLDPMAALDQNTDFRLTATTDVTDLAGNSLDQFAGQPLDSFIAEFRTGGEDRTPPCVFETIPADGDENVPVATSVSIRFTEPIMAVTVTTASFYVSGPGGNVAGTFQFMDNNATTVFLPAAPLTADTLYTVTATTAITDPSGNGLDGDCDGSSGPSYMFNFTPGAGGIVINEVVVDPQQDWNDTEGGDGNPFNGVPGSGSITTSDEWIELFNASGQTIDLNGWTLEMTDTTPETHLIGGGSGTEVFFPATATVTSFTPGAYLVIGNPTGSNNMECYFALRDANGNLVDDVEIGDDPENDGEGDGAPEPGEDGNADSVANEAVARVPNGIDSDNDVADCIKQMTTIGLDNGGSRGFGTNAGYWGTGVGLIGMSGIAAAGPAPDNPGIMSQLAFAVHTRRGIIYGIDLDDGPYYLMGSDEAPMGVEYVAATGDPQPGKGFLFVTYPEIGNMARLRIRPTGPVGDPATISGLDTTQPNSLVYMTYPLMQNPVGIAYSAEFDRLYVACRGNGLILEVTPDGDLTEIFDTGFGADALGGIDVGDMGNGDVIFVTHTGGERVDTGDGPRGSVQYFDPHP
ncbi:Ig-like domain-containing protein [bacterium]|nr:Ig-like domain-containing protein [candidate division CSSED10-310 bacterium]